MTNAKSPRFLGWAREIQALAQSGHQYAKDDYQRDRCLRLMEIAAEMISENTGIDYRPLAKAFSSQTGYATPKIDVRAAVFAEQTLLMVRERLDGGWTLPGGWVDVGDTPSKARVPRPIRDAVKLARHAVQGSGMNASSCDLSGRET